MIKSITVLLTLEILIGSGQARAKPPEEWAIPTQFRIESDAPPKTKEQLSMLTSIGFKMVSTYPPPELTNTLFQWSGDQSILKGKELTVVLANSYFNFQKYLPGTTGRHFISRDMDSALLVHGDKANGKVQIVLAILIDRIFYDEQLRSRRNSLARLVVALAREIYGNLQIILESPIDAVQPMTDKLWARQRVRAFQTSILFIRNLLKHPLVNLIPANVQTDLKQLMSREKDSLQTAAAEVARLRCQSITED